MQDEWEKHYTVVNFDQRNTGKTYLANKDKAIVVGQTGSVEDYVNDIICSILNDLLKRDEGQLIR